MIFDRSFWTTPLFAGMSGNGSDHQSMIENNNNNNNNSLTNLNLNLNYYYFFYCGLMT